MLTYETDDATGTMEFTVGGTISRAEFDAAVAAMEAAIARHGRINAVTRILSFTGMELSAWLKDIGWGWSHVKNVRRVAVVTNSGWVGMLTQASGYVLPVELRLFTADEMADARAWARAGKG